MADKGDVIVFTTEKEARTIGKVVAKRTEGNFFSKKTEYKVKSKGKTFKVKEDDVVSVLRSS